MTPKNRLLPQWLLAFLTLGVCNVCVVYAIDPSAEQIVSQLKEIVLSGPQELTSETIILIAQGLRNGDCEVRELALGAVAIGSHSYRGRVNNGRESTPPQLIRVRDDAMPLLDDECRQARLAAILAMTHLDSALQTYGHANDDVMVAFSRRYSQEPEGRLRLEIVKAIAGSITAHSAITRSVISRALDDDDPSVRQSALLTACVFSPTLSRDQVMRAIGDPEPRVRASAITAAAGCVADSASLVPLLDSLLATEQDGLVKTEIERALDAAHVKAQAGR